MRVHARDYRYTINQRQRESEGTPIPGRSRNTGLACARARARGVFSRSDHLWEMTGAPFLPLKREFPRKVDPKPFHGLFPVLSTAIAPEPSWTHGVAF